MAGTAAIAQRARIAQVAATAALFHGVGGRGAALTAIRQRAGRALAPGLVELLARRGGEALGVLDSVLLGLGSDGADDRVLDQRRLSTKSRHPGLAGR